MNRSPCATAIGLRLKGYYAVQTGNVIRGAFDYRFYLARRGGFGILYPHRGQEIVPTDRAGFPLLRWTEKLRRRVEGVIDAAYHEHQIHPQVLKGMFLGQQSGLSPDILNAFRNSGSIHILAVSGLHVGLIATGLFFRFFAAALASKSHRPADNCRCGSLCLPCRFSPVGFPCIADGGYFPNLADYRAG